MRQMFDENEIRKIVKQDAPQINKLDLTYGEPTVTYDTTDGLSINSTMKQILSNGASAEGQMDLSIPIVPGNGIVIDKVKNENKVIIKTQLKTLFGNQSIVGSGNIDIYKHNIKGTAGSSTFYLRIYSSNNLKANSLTDLKTLLGDTFEESVTGSNGIMAITETKILFEDGTDASISGYTITDKVTTI